MTSLRAVAAAAQYKNHTEQQLTEVLDAWARWQRALQEKDRIGKECKEAETAAYAKFTDKIEEGIDARAEKADVVVAHFETVTEWGNYQDVLAGCKEARKAAREVVQEAAALMNKKMQDSKQMMLPLTGEPDGDENDD